MLSKKRQKKVIRNKGEPTKTRIKRAHFFFCVGKSLATPWVELLIIVFARCPLVTGVFISKENRQTARTLRISRKTLSRFTEDKVSPVARKTLGNFLTLFRLYYICIYSNVEFDLSRYLLESCGVFCFVWCWVLYAFATGVGVRFKEKDISHRISFP